MVSGNIDYYGTTVLLIFKWTCVSLKRDIVNYLTLNKGLGSLTFFLAVACFYHRSSNIATFCAIQRISYNPPIPSMQLK